MKLPLAFIEQFARLIDRVAAEQDLAQVGDSVVLLTGQPLGCESMTHAIALHTLGRG
jgi:hypothetical protein